MEEILFFEYLKLKPVHPQRWQQIINLPLKNMHCIVRLNKVESDRTLRRYLKKKKKPCIFCVSNNHNHR